MKTLACIGAVYFVISAIIATKNVLERRAARTHS